MEILHRKGDDLIKTISDLPTFVEAGFSSELEGW